MVTLTVQLKLPDFLGGGDEALSLLHPGYGNGSAIAHDVVSVTLAAVVDAGARLWDASGNMHAIPRAWVRSWRTTG
jgi:hypothetical protein